MQSQRKGNRMPTNRNADVAAIAQEINRYLDSHPNAADSLKGVLRWWLLRQRYEDSVETVCAALEYLVAVGEVSKTVTPKGKAVYSRVKRDHEQKYQH